MKYFSIFFLFALLVCALTLQNAVCQSDNKATKEGDNLVSSEAGLRKAGKGIKKIW